MKFLNLGCGSCYSDDPAWVNVDLHSTGPGVITHDLYNRLPFRDGEFDAVYHSDVLEHLNKRFVPIFIGECKRVLKPGGILRVATPDLEAICRAYLDILKYVLTVGDAEAQGRYDWIMTELLDQMTRHKRGGEIMNYWKRDPVPAYDFVIRRVGSEAARAIAHVHKHGELPDPDPGPVTAEERDPYVVGRFRLSGECHLWMYDRYSLGRLLRRAGFGDVRQCRADESAIPGFNSYLLDVEADGSVRKPDSFYMEGRKP
jgi:SAM-dependent methyltransferase